MSHNRRRFLEAAGATSLTGLAATATAVPSFADSKDDGPKLPKGRAEHVIMVWLGGGACQIDTWDPKRVGDAKRKNEKPGSFYPSIPTAIEGVRVCEHLAKCADRLDRFNPLRTVHHDVVDEHAAATNRMHTGRATSGTIVYPSLGSVVAHELGAAGEGVPAYVLVGYPNLTRGPGFLGAKANFVYLLDTASGPAGFQRPEWVTDERQTRRERLLGRLRAEYRQRTGDDPLVKAYDESIDEALRLSGPEFESVFQLDREPADLRNAYGGEFGQRCLLARRLVERGVRFIEVSHNLNFVNGTGWDTHNDGQLKQHLLVRELDSALASLVDDLEEKKLLDKTLIVVNTEFGRPAGFDGGGGRGHHPHSFSVVLAGGGLRTGRAIGTTDELGMKVEEDPVSVPDLFATVHHALGIDPAKELYAGERPVPITDGGRPIAALFS